MDFRALQSYMDGVEQLCEEELPGFFGFTDEDLVIVGHAFEAGASKWFAYEKVKHSHDQLLQGLLMSKRTLKAEALTETPHA